MRLRTTDNSSGRISDFSTQNWKNLRGFHKVWRYYKFRKIRSLRPGQQLYMGDGRWCTTFNRVNQKCFVMKLICRHRTKYVSRFSSPGQRDWPHIVVRHWIWPSISFFWKSNSSKMQAKYDYGAMTVAYDNSMHCVWTRTFMLQNELFQHSHRLN